MRCEELLVRAIESVSPDDTAQFAALKMRESNVGFLPVCDSERNVVGVLTDRDLATRLVADGQPATTPVRRIMTKEDIVTCQADDELDEPERLMREHEIGRVVVVDDQDHLAGVVSLADIVRYQDEGESVDAVRDVTEREVEEPLS
jgi:CBS domain-containing protein